MPETTQILRNQIEYNDEFDSTSYVHQLMLSSINDNLIHYLLAYTSVFIVDTSETLNCLLIGIGVISYEFVKRALSPHP